MQVFRRLKPKKSSGPDGLHNILLKRLATSSCDTLPFIFQASFRAHVLPASWLHAVIISVFKQALLCSIELRSIKYNLVTAKIGILVALKSVIYFRFVSETIVVEPILLTSRTKQNL